MASVIIRSGRLYLQYYDSMADYSRYESLKMKNTQENLREAKRIANNYTPDFVKKKMYVYRIRFLTFSEHLKNSYLSKLISRKLLSCID